MDIFYSVYNFFSFLSPSLWETARYRLKYCLKEPFSPKQPTTINSSTFAYTILRILIYDCLWTNMKWTWHITDGKHHNQIGDVLGRKCFRSRVNIHTPRSFPGEDIGIDHDLVMMTFRVHLKKARKPNQPRLRFDLEKLRNTDKTCTFQAARGGKFAPGHGLPPKIQQ